MQHHRRTIHDVVLYCNVDADSFHNLIQVVAEDNATGGSVTATLFQQPVQPVAPPQLVVSVTTTDQPGVQRATTFFEGFALDELNFMYYIEMVITRSSPEDIVRAYSVSLRDVL